MSISFEPIGIIHTPFKIMEGMPIHFIEGKGIKGSIELKEEYVPGLLDLDKFSHIILIFQFHRSLEIELQPTTFRDNKMHGVFSTRTPRRPNHIGISLVKLLSIRNNILNFENVDMIDGTPLLDIKPFIPDFYKDDLEKNGWIEKQN